MEHGDLHETSPSGTTSHRHNVAAPGAFASRPENVRPELAASTTQQLEELSYWSARAKGVDGLDHGYWHVWEPPVNLDSLRPLAEGKMHAFSLWLVRQLRSQRDAVASVSANLLKLHLSLPAGATAESAALAEAGLAALTDLPRRLEAIEERERAVASRLDRLNEDVNVLPRHTPPLPRTSQTVPPGADDVSLEVGSKVHQKLSEQALKECKQSVTLISDMFTSLRKDQDALKLLFLEKLEKTEAAMTALDAKTSKTFSDEIQAALQRIEARVKPFETRFESTQQLAIQMSEWKERKSAFFEDFAQRLESAEQTIATMSEDIEGLTEDMVNFLARSNKEGGQPSRSGSIKQRRSLAPGRSDSFLSPQPASPNSSLFLQGGLAAQRVAEKAEWDQLVQDVKVNEDFQLLVLKNFKNQKDGVDERFNERMVWLESKLKQIASNHGKRIAIGHKPRSSSPDSSSPVRADTVASRNMWPQRDNALKTHWLPNLPPSSLAQEEFDDDAPKQTAMTATAYGPCLDGLPDALPLVPQERAESPEAMANRVPTAEAGELQPGSQDSTPQEIAEARLLQQQQRFQQELHKKLFPEASAGGCLEVQPPPRDVKDRFLPPTGGCFNHQSKNSRLGCRSRPRTANGSRGSRPSTPGR
eukprot:TRINITY_DN27258_c0_g1_i2.p1 TRINITY_DN27258_c0_g1~~TRINITY_DN27258_c0_g1_i2.p1  ORF type:complete len:645 (-),score=156.74 TRINITY_DN27258_c0_g1_i2:36-1970(-)